MGSATKVVVCGSGFGSLYAHALSRASGRYEISAIVARGSHRSQALARRYRVPLFRNVGDVSDPPDVAVVAVGRRAGIDLCAQWLARGVPVLLEHPVEPEGLSRLLASAAKRGTRLHVNTHFADLPACRRFLARAAKLASGQALRSVAASFNLRTLYSGIDLLQRATAPRKLASIPIDMRVASRRDPDDGSYVLDGHQVSLQFERCQLLLASAAGPVVQVNAPGRLPVWQVLSAGAPDWREFDRETRGAALLAAIAALRSGRADSAQRPARLLEVSRLWRKTLQRLLRADRAKGAFLLADR